MKFTTSVACILLCAAGNAQTKTLGAASTWHRNLASYGVIWPHTCDEVFGVALTMPSAQQVDNPTEITVSIAGQNMLAKNPTEYAFTVPIAGRDTRVELEPIELEPVPSSHIHSDFCVMAFPLRGPTNEKDFGSTALWDRKCKAWVDSLPLTRMEIKKADEPPESEFQKTSMMELKRIAAEAGY